MRRLIQVIAVLALLGIFVVIATIAAIFIVTGESPANAVRDVFLQYTLNQRSSELYAPFGDGDTIRFTVQPGTSTSQIGQNLYNARLISDATLFINYTIANDLDAQLEAGTYFLSSRMAIPEIAERLTDSNSSQLAFRILEGWRKEEIAAAIDQNGLFAFTGADFLAVVGAGATIPRDFAAYASIPAGASLEGFLYPDTYLLPPDITPEGLRDILLNTFRERVTVDMVNTALAQGLDLYEVVTLASISEREAVHAEEHPMILSVYRNRLNIGMKLDADPTIQYALNGTRGDWWPSITRDDYSNINSTYNTYLYNGLPPSPISNPGIASIEATIYPAVTDYLYFRAFCDNSGYHEFASTYEEHLANGCTG